MGVGDKHWHYIHKMTGSTALEIDLSTVAIQYGMDYQGLWIFGFGASNTNPGRQSLYFINTEGSVLDEVSPKAYSEDIIITSMTLLGTILKLTFSNEWMYFGLRKL